MDKVSVFESSDFGELRIIVDPKGDVWFVASDVAKSLGYINAKDAVKRHVDDDDSMLLQVSDNQWGVKRSILKTRYIDSIRIINESGLYSLILSSKLESAKRFKKWVTSEVLPSIRKTGEYKTSSGGKGILVPDFSNPADAARAWADQYEAAQKAIAEKSQAEAEKQQALKTIEEHKPDVEFAESFRKVDHNNMWLIRDIAKKLEQNGVIIAEKNLRSFLEEAKFMFRNGLGKWELYSNVVVKGYGVYRSYFIDKYSGDRINQQTIYMTGSGYEVTRILVNHVVSNGINTIIIGHNKCWKQEINIGKRNNQNFVSIPFNVFISMISYKATLEGINVKIVEESYTSKCSFLDNERICKHESYKGRRTKRGLFKTSSGKTINADINGAFNIIRKSAKESFDVTMLPKGRGFWWNPVRISV